MYRQAIWENGKNSHHMRPLILSLMFPSLAFANVVWPGLIMAQRMPIWAIPAGLIIETSIFIVVMKRSPLNSFGIVAAVNILPATWLFTIGAATAISYFFEVKALKWFFKMPLEKREKRLFLLANVVSTLLAFGSIFIIKPL